MILALLFAPLMWALDLLAFIVLALAGFVLVPVALLCGAYSKQPTPFGPMRVLFTWRIMAPYSNLEDGEFDPNKGRVISFWNGFYWSCLRNPVNGQRFIWPFTALIDAAKIRFVGSLGRPGELHPEDYELKAPNWFFVSQGPFKSCFWWQFKAAFTIPLIIERGSLYRFWLGNMRLYPADIKGGPYGYRQFGTAGVQQFKPVQMGDNHN